MSSGVIGAAPSVFLKPFKPQGSHPPSLPRLFRKAVPRITGKPKSGLPNRNDKMVGVNLRFIEHATSWQASLYGRCWETGIDPCQKPAGMTHCKMTMLGVFSREGELAVHDIAHDGLPIHGFALNDQA